MTASLLNKSDDFEDIVREKYDVVPDWLPMGLVNVFSTAAFMIEHSPLKGLLATREVLVAKRRGVRKSYSSILEFPIFLNKISVVVPCHNEGMNIDRLVNNLMYHYSDYIYEIILVDDNSKYDTADRILACGQRDERVKLIKRLPPNGVGLTLKEGYAAATGEYILSMDCDFVETLPEFRDLLKAVSKGHDGAIGNRFSYQSLMVNYPFGKMMCNRLFHLVVRIITSKRVHDITNNLKLYRAEVFKDLDLVEPHFSANLETGLKPILKGYRLVEVPVSWINRRADMGTSSFRVLYVGLPYLMSLVRSIRTVVKIKQDAISPGKLSDGNPVELGIRNSAPKNQDS